MVFSLKCTFSKCSFNKQLEKADQEMQQSVGGWTGQAVANGMNAQAKQSLPLLLSLQAVAVFCSLLKGRQQSRVLFLRGLSAAHASHAWIIFFK